MPASVIIADKYHFHDHTVMIFNIVSLLIVIITFLQSSLSLVSLDPSSAQIDKGTFIISIVLKKIQANIGV